MAERPETSSPESSASGRSPEGRQASPPMGVLPDNPFPHAAPAVAREPFSDSQFFRRTLLVAGVTVLTGALLALLWYASDVFLLLFGGIMIAVLLRAPVNWLTAHTPLGEGLALMVSILVLFGAILGLLYLFTFPLAEQIATLIETLPQALTRMRLWLREYEWTRPLQPLITELSRVRVDNLTLGRATWILSSTAAAVGGILVVLFIGIYLAAQPRLYQRGFMHLLPRNRRPRAYEVLDTIGTVLRRWLVGRLITMTVVGAAAGLGLWWLGVPLAFTLGVLTGLLEFIPYLGPVLAALAPLLIAFNMDPAVAFYVLLLYVFIQTAESYLLTPLVEQRAVALPPALVVFSTILLAALAGPLGVVLASPLTATFIVAVKLLYVEDVVEQPMPS
jgi:predicted PurR-regulated permease PerM